MKTFMKLTIVAGIALAMTTFGTSNANAGVVIAVGLPVAPVYVRAAIPAPVYCAPAPVVYAAPYRCVYPYARFGCGWGWGGRHFVYRHR
jgi:hypothetical protein